MTVALGLLLVLVASVGQVSIVPEFSIFGAQPNAVVVLLAAWIAVRGQRETLVLVPAAGLVLGLLDSQPLGVALLALAPLMLADDVRFIQSDLIFGLLLAAAGTLVYESAGLLTLAVTGERPDWLATMLDVLLPAVIANALLFLPAFGLLRAFSGEPQRRPVFG